MGGDSCGPCLTALGQDCVGALYGVVHGGSRTWSCDDADVSMCSNAGGAEQSHDVPFNACTLTARGEG